MAGYSQEHEAESWPPALYHQMPAILEYLEDHRVVVVSAAPGSGKSSVLPRCLAESGYGPVLCAQPRHFAAFVAVAKVGQEWDSDIEFTTTRQLLDRFSSQPPVLAGYGAVVIDEAHDRTLGTDVLLGMVKAALATGRMGQCKVVVCTAGGPADGMLCAFFGGAPVISSLRAAHPVEVRYSRGPVLDMAAAVADEVAAIHASQPPGDVLVFLPENADIIDVHAKLLDLPLPVSGLAVRYVHDNLPAELIDFMLNSLVPDGRRRVVLANDVAETAVLVHGITYVVDTGLVSEQPPVRISKAAAAARAAIAGFSGPGRCHRLYQQEEYDGLDEHTIPHIGQDGAAVKFALMVKRHAADGIPGFEIFDPALKPAMLKNVFGQLVNGGYLDKLGNLTDKGEREAYDED
uniref:Helicase C-terminal domain-containing protein n=1 Tax=Oryza punctata TaxID=4537 RepID=A0A0E0KC57_ORYPU